MPANKQVDSWHTLTGAGCSGSVRVKATRVEESILPLKEYQALAQLLMNPDLAVANLLFEANRVCFARLYCNIVDDIVFRNTSTKSRAAS